VHCDGPTPYDPHKFVRDLIRELRKRAGQFEQPPCFPQRSWWSALAIADERDRVRFVSSLNSAGDDHYFERQHICAAAAITAKDGFSIAHIHRSASGINHTAPQTDSYALPPNHHDRYRRNYGDKAGRGAAAAANR
jgi:hypothetical protein